MDLEQRRSFTLLALRDIRCALLLVLIRPNLTYFLIPKPSFAHLQCRPSRISKIASQTSANASTAVPRADIKSYQVYRYYCMVIKGAARPGGVPLRGTLPRLASHVRGSLLVLYNTYFRTIHVVRGSCARVRIYF